MLLVGNDEYTTERLELPNKQTIGVFHPLVFYLQDDELAFAAEAFLSFVSENGPDLDHLEVVDLINILKHRYQKTMKLGKVESSRSEISESIS